jgi:DNA-binding GntR family transcriptional regulator
MGRSERKRTSAKQSEIRLWIEQEIAEGRVRPGDALNERSLCMQFNVSRTPVREALLQLASVGLVVFESRHGAVVATMNVQQIAAMWEVLTHLEGLCAKLCARRLIKPDLDVLRAAYKRGSKAVEKSDVAMYAEANKEYHELVYHGCKNEFLADQVRGIRTRLNPYRKFPFQRSGGMERSLAGHKAVLDALAVGDDEAADRAMREHVAGGLSFLDLVAELPAHTTTAAPIALRSEPKMRPASAPARKKIAPASTPATSRKATK